MTTAILEDKETEALAKGWLHATPLENYSSLHELSLGALLGMDLTWPQKHFFIEINFNLHTPLSLRPDTYLTFHTLDADKPPASPDCCYSITNIKRWRADIKPYKTYGEFIDSRIRWNRCNAAKSEKMFNEYGCTITFVEDDWSEYVETVYRLYCIVAKKHGEKLYDIHYFQEAAKRPDYKLLCAWHEGEMIGMFLLQEELPTLHSICCGLDYDHTTKSYAYSWMHYAFIKYAIEAGKYESVDVGITADEFKRMIGFEEIPSRMDIYSKGFFTKSLLRFASYWLSATITAESKLKFGMKH